jgi:hypothetical protein
MHELLRRALTRPNVLILNGVVETLAMLGDPEDVDSLDALLAAADQLETKLAVLRLIPAFCLPSERARFSYIRYAAGYERVAAPGVLEPLRRPPLTRRGRLDAAHERLRGRVIRGIVGQFDPVGAALRFMDDARFGPSAKAAVEHFVGNGLGNEPAFWPRIWAAQSAEMSLRVPEEVEEIRLAALQSLADMGAEALPEVLDAFARLDGGGEIIRQALFETLIAMCRTAYADLPALADMRFGAEDQVEAENWRSRRYASTGRLAAFAASAAEKALAGNPDESVFDAAARVLGAALSGPDEYPDPDGEIARAKTLGLVILERLLLMPDLSPGNRMAVAGALGDVGFPAASAALAGILDSPYCSPEFGAEGMRMAEAVVDALRNIAAGNRGGAAAARETLLRLLADTRVFPSPRPDAPPTGLAHMALWRLQRLARTDTISLDPGQWRGRLGW